MSCKRFYFFLLLLIGLVNGLAIIYLAYHLIQYIKEAKDISFKLAHHNADQISEKVNHELMRMKQLTDRLAEDLTQGIVSPHCTGQKIKIADIVDKYDALAPLTHSRAASGSRAAPLACLVDLRGCFESDQIHSEKHSWLGVYVFLYESVSDH